MTNHTLLASVQESGWTFAELHRELGTPEKLIADVVRGVRRRSELEMRIRALLNRGPKTAAPVQTNLFSKG